jgi:hypothetical protein
MPRAGMKAPSAGGLGPGAVPRSSHDGASIGRPVIVGPLDDVSGRRHSASGPGRLVLLSRYPRELGLEPVLVTRIGDDATGRRILGRLQGWGLDTSAVQVDHFFEQRRHTDFRR